MSQHYLFVHSFLSGLYWSDPSALRRRLQGALGMAFLHRLWTHAGLHAAQAGPEGLRSVQGLGMEEKGAWTVVRLPAPADELEAFFLAMSWEPLGFFTLERSRGDLPVVCSWRGAEHKAHRDLDRADLDLFLESIRPLV